MNLFTQTIQRIKPLNEKAMEEAEQRWRSIAKPLGGLGLLEPLIVQIAGITGSAHINIGKKQVVVFCADNGVVAEGVTQTSQDVTAIVAKNLTIGATSVCKMASIAGAQVIPVDVGVAEDISSVQGIVHKNVARGTKNFVNGPAMTKEEAIQAIEVGIEMAQQAKRTGCGLFAAGEMGIGNTTTSSAIAAVMMEEPVEMVTGRGAGLDSAGLQRKITVIQKAIDLLEPDKEDSIDVLAKVGGLDIAAMVGAYLGAASVGLPVLIDGFISAAAALLAVKICPEVRSYLLATHVSREPAAHRILEMLDLHPLLYADMHLGEGTGAVAVMPLLDMAVAVYSQMPTFNDISIEAYQPLK